MSRERSSCLTASRVALHDKKVSVGACRGSKQWLLLSGPPCRSLVACIASSTPPLHTRAGSAQETGRQGAPRTRALVELGLGARGEEEVINGNAADGGGDDENHVPVEGLVVQRVEAAAEQHQLLRMHREIAKVLSVAQRCVRVGHRLLEVEARCRLERTPPRELHGYVHLHEAVMRDGRGGREVIAVGGGGFEEADGLVGELERLGEEVGDDVAVS
jgi:hypothetical protein